MKAAVVTVASIAAAALLLLAAMTAGFDRQCRWAQHHAPDRVHDFCGDRR